MTTGRSEGEDMEGRIGCCVRLHKDERKKKKNQNATPLDHQSSHSTLRSSSTTRFTSGIIINHLIQL